MHLGSSRSSVKSLLNGLTEVKRLLPWLVASMVLALPAQGQDKPLEIAVTFSVLGDIVEQVAGPEGQVRVLTPINAEVHEWELSPSNFASIEKADVVFYNGYQLEQWMYQIEATLAEDIPLVAVAEASGYPTRSIVTGDLSGDIDPHLWLDPGAVEQYVGVIAETLSDLAPAHGDAFMDRADAFRTELRALKADLADTLNQIPEQQRLLVTSEAAFLYFADAFGFAHFGIWGNNAEQAGAPRQLMKVIDQVKAQEVATLFWESTISDRHVRNVARDTGSEVAGPLYVDSLSHVDGPAPTYLEMMKYNVNLIVDHLGAN